MASIRLDHVSKVFQLRRGAHVEALQDVTLLVPNGRLLTVLGPSGSGKTTLLRLITGLEEPTKGTIFLDDRVVNSLPPRDRNVAMVFQHAGLYPHMTVYQNIVFGLKIRGLPSAEIEKRLSETCEMLGVTSLLGRLPHSLSAGEQQRVALARALARRPTALLLDEPFSNLDMPTRSELRLELKKLYRALGTTIVHVTHDQAEALALGEQVAVLHQGRVQQVSIPELLYDQPANLFVATFVGWPPMNLARGVVERQSNGFMFRIVERSHPDKAPQLRFAIPERFGSILMRRGNEDLMIGLRPEELLPCADHAGSKTESVIDGVVELAELVGAQVHVRLNLGGWHCIASWHRHHTPTVGQKVLVKIDSQKARFFDPRTGTAIVL